jgi:hypothetical protein
MKPIQITLEVSTAEDAALLRRLAKRLDEVREATFSAPHGKAIEVCEARAVEVVSETGSMMISAILQERIAAAEKKGRPPAAAAIERRTAKVRGRIG